MIDNIEDVKVCVWAMDENHQGEVKCIDLAWGHDLPILKIPICERHLKWHHAIISLADLKFGCMRTLTLNREECLSTLAELSLPKAIVPVGDLDDDWYDAILTLYKHGVNRKEVRALSREECMNRIKELGLAIEKSVSYDDGTSSSEED